MNKQKLVPRPFLARIAINTAALVETWTCSHDWSAEQIHLEPGHDDAHNLTTQVVTFRQCRKCCKRDVLSRETRIGGAE